MDFGRISFPSDLVLYLFGKTGLDQVRPGEEPRYLVAGAPLELLLDLALEAVVKPL